MIEDEDDVYKSLLNEDEYDESEIPEGHEDEKIEDFDGIVDDDELNKFDSF